MLQWAVGKVSDIFVDVLNYQNVYNRDKCSKYETCAVFTGCMFENFRN